MEAMITLKTSEVLSLSTPLVLIRNISYEPITWKAVKYLFHQT